MVSHLREGRLSIYIYLLLCLVLAEHKKKLSEKSFRQRGAETGHWKVMGSF